MLRLQKNKKIINITIWILFFALLSPTHNVFAATKTITPVGNAQIDTAQSKFGGASGLLDGTGDYIHRGQQ